MKRILTILCALLISIVVKKKKKKTDSTVKAKELTAEMTEVLELDEETAKSVLEFQLEKWNGFEQVKKDNKGDKDAMKAKKKALVTEYKKDMIELLGEENMKKWSKHVNARKKESKK